MSTTKPTMTFGWRVYGLGVIAMALVSLAWRDFDPGGIGPEQLRRRQPLGDKRGGQAQVEEVRARLAAILLTIMYACFTPLVHIPLLLSDPSSQFNWAENALNLALVGAAWVVADSLARPLRQRLAAGDQNDVLAN